MQKQVFIPVILLIAGIMLSGNGSNHFQNIEMLHIWIMLISVVAINIPLLYVCKTQEQRNHIKYTKY